MNVTGTLTCVDWPHYTSFQGFVGGLIDGTSVVTDSSHSTDISGYVVCDSTRFYPDMTFTQGQILGRGDWEPVYFPGDPVAPPKYTVSDKTNYDPTSSWVSRCDPPLWLVDKTYVGGSLVDGTYVDGTMIRRWYDPVWINWSLWYTEDPRNILLIGNKERQAGRMDVGRYYTAMVVPRPTGHYEIRWRWQKNQLSCAHEAVQGFLNNTAGIDAMVIFAGGWGEGGWGEGAYGE